MDKRLILAIQFVCNERAIVLPWDAIGKHLDVSPGAISQHMAKLRQRLVTWGFGVPPPLRRSSGLGTASSSRGPGGVSRELNSGKVYEIEEYMNEDDEELDLKEEFSDDCSELEIDEPRVIKKGGSRIVVEDNDEDEDVKPQTRVQPTRRARQKRAAIPKEESDDDFYDSPTEARLQKRARERAEAAAAAWEARKRTTPTPEEPILVVTEMRGVEGGKQLPSGGAGDANGGKQPGGTDIDDMFSEFSRPIGVNTAVSAKLVGMLADYTYSPGHHQHGLEQRPAGERSMGQDQGNSHNLTENRGSHQWSSAGAESGLFADQDDSQSALDRSRFSAATSAHISTPPVTPKNRMPSSPYANSAIARNVLSPLSSAVVGRGDSGQRIVPIPATRIAMQHQLTAMTTPGALRQSDGTSPSGASYPTPPSYSHFGTSTSPANGAIKQEPRDDPRYNGRNTFGTQYYGGGERPHFDGLGTSHPAGATDPFASMDMGYSSYLHPEDALNNYDVFSDDFVKFD
ncbi:hypothetical protein FGG08_007348 [Glutinoglossum americanum]|uniref:Uncharacterized protein n=1 Tax=Glutinoglossum americanum TaxID=1670608 RepID=A0A9P8I1M2_9PEZI|nr:hypothetical protein FGG08_007348 [Glutinoglossum americanum]